MSTATLEVEACSSIWQKCLPWLVVFSAALFFFFQFIQINMLNSLGTELFSYFQTDSAGVAHIAASYFYGNVLLLFPAGIILDRCSTRRTLLLAMFLLILSTVAFGLSHTVVQAQVARFFCGVTGAFCLLGVVRVASRWFLPTQMAFIIGLSITFAMTGGMVAQTPVSELVQHYGFFYTIMIDALVGVGFFVLMAIFLRDYPAGQAPKSSQQHFDARAFFADLWVVIKNTQNWLAGIYASLINLPVFLLGGYAADKYLQQVAHLSLHDASVVSEGLFIGLIIGCPLFGWCSDKMKRRKLPMFVGALVSIVMMLLIMHNPLAGFSMQLVLFFLLGLFISSQTIAYPLVAESNHEKVTGSANAIASLLIMSGGFLIPMFTQLLNSHWDHQLVGGEPLYQVSDFHHAFMMMLVAFVLSFIVTFFLKETRCERYSEQ